ncbi:putative protein kinase RLK-Pelle-CrRLK1L-1 family [Helianthus annuus]|nr:putative protein kinase RLK-Pelle-CrRLK1L-1 family [Helianthus annuus]
MYLSLFMCILECLINSMFLSSIYIFWYIFFSFEIVQCGEFVHANGCTTIVAKRWDLKSYDDRNVQFFTEPEILKDKHENIIGLFGYCNEMDEKIIVYEHASNGRLNQHLDDPNLTWIKRLKICIHIANGLLYLHRGGGELLSHKTTVYDRAEHVDGNARDSLGYIDPQYKIVGFLTEDSDTYSLGGVLLEMLCGRLVWAEGCEDYSQSLVHSVAEHYDKNKA